MFLCNQLLSLVLTKSKETKKRKLLEKKTVRLIKVTSLREGSSGIISYSHKSDFKSEATSLKSEAYET